MEPPAPATDRPLRLSIVIPVYNEEKTVLEILRRVQEVEVPVEKEIIVVDDGSRDRTPQLLTEAGRDGSFRLHLCPVNQGKGAAVRTGFSLATGDILLVQDADLENDPADYAQLLAPILAGNAKVVYGSRFSQGRHRTWTLSYCANQFLIGLTNLLYGANLTDMETCYKVFRREVIQAIRLTCSRFEFEPEVTAKVLRSGFRIFEVPVSYRPRTAAEGKKIAAKDGFQAVYHLLKWRFANLGAVQAATTLKEEHL